MTKPKRKHVRTRPVVATHNFKVAGRSKVHAADDANLRIDPPESPNGPAGSAPAESPAALPPANPLGELVPVLEASAEPAADAQAAFASLEPRPDAAAVPGLHVPTDGAPLTAAPNETRFLERAEKPGPLPPGYVHWGDKRMRAMRKTQLTARVQELQKLVETRPAPAPVPLAGPVQTPATLDECKELVGMLIPAVDSLLVFFGGDEFKQADKDRELLTNTWAPVAFPHYETVKHKLPWLPAGIGTLGVYVPKVIEKLKAQREKRTPRERSPNGEATGAEEIAGVTRLRPFGGPDA